MATDTSDWSKGDWDNYMANVAISQGNASNMKQALQYVGASHSQIASASSSSLPNSNSSGHENTPTGRSTNTGEATISSKSLQEKMHAHFRGLKKKIPIWQAKQILKEQGYKVAEKAGQLEATKKITRAARAPQKEFLKGEYIKKLMAPMTSPALQLLKLKPKQTKQKQINQKATAPKKKNDIGTREIRAVGAATHTVEKYNIIPHSMYKDTTNALTNLHKSHPRISKALAEMGMSASDIHHGIEAGTSAKNAFIGTVGMTLMAPGVAYAWGYHLKSYAKGTPAIVATIPALIVKGAKNTLKHPFKTLPGDAVSMLMFKGAGDVVGDAVPEGAGDVVPKIKYDSYDLGGGDTLKATTETDKLGKVSGKIIKEAHPNKIRSLSVLKAKGEYTEAHPILSIGGKNRLSLFKIPKVDITTEIEAPKTPFETDIIAHNVPEEAGKIKYFRAVKKETTQVQYAPKEIKPAIAEVVKESKIASGKTSMRVSGDIITTLKEHDGQLYGSVLQKQSGLELGTEALGRGPRDIDVMVKNPEEFAQKITARINRRVGHRAVKVEEGKVIGVKTGDKLFDIHDKGEGQGYGLNKNNDYIGYGIKLGRSARSNEGLDEITLGEQTTRKGVGSMMKIHPKSEDVGDVSGQITPEHEGRVKDIADYYNGAKAEIELLKAKGKTAAATRADEALNNWMDQWGKVGEDARKIGEKAEGKPEPKVKLYDFSKSKPTQSSSIYENPIYALPAAGTRETPSKPSKSRDAGKKSRSSSVSISIPRVKPVRFSSSFYQLQSKPRLKSLYAIPSYTSPSPPPSSPSPSSPSTSPRSPSPDSSSPSPPPPPSSPSPIVSDIFSLPGEIKRGKPFIPRGHQKTAKKETRKRGEVGYIKWSIVNPWADPDELFGLGKKKGGKAKKVKKPKNKRRRS